MADPNDHSFTNLSSKDCVEPEGRLKQDRIAARNEVLFYLWSSKRLSPRRLITSMAIVKIFLVPQRELDAVGLAAGYVRALREYRETEMMLWEVCRPERSRHGPHSFFSDGKGGKQARILLLGEHQNRPQGRRRHLLELRGL